ncbi:Asp-tRNA(Asn)/Glu-tRNA(Gln) amidotransferase A subunit family amidase [Azospirillum agricola]|uniref:amidase n=1 Tax=Azospirillum agricola TaxID=1720247 RepID=UPI001AE49F83|nr:amidase [Azospirillum agricola]MBP2232589.1 Asp-tRNA(Asn)/Glu-tRNA(Gln) amidotransferase A subunit family amidase [Azospirillum agricola]
MTDASPRDPAQAVAAALAAARASRLNAFIELFPDAEERARALSADDPRPAPWGLPFAHKDVFVTAGRQPTVGVGHGYRWSGGRTSVALDRLAAAGAIAIGALNLDPHCYAATGLNPYFGRVLNPLEARFAVGGSSSGSAAAVAAGIVPFALGTDTGGSVRIPAALCGVLGFKPTAGAIGDPGIAPLSPSQDVIGIIARVPALLRAVFAVLRDPAPMERSDPGTGPLRVGLPAEWIRTGTDPEIATILHAFLRRMTDDGAVAAEVGLPPLDALNACAGTITSFEASALHRTTLAERPDWYPAAVERRLVAAAEVGRDAYDQALRDRAAHRAAVLDGAFRTADVLLCPVIGGLAPRLDGVDDDDVTTAGATTLAFLRFNRPFSLLGLPALALPAGRDRNRMPVGVQIVGRPGADDLLLTIAERFGGPLSGTA